MILTITMTSIFAYYRTHKKVFCREAKNQKKLPEPHETQEKLILKMHVMFSAGKKTHFFYVCLP